MMSPGSGATRSWIPVAGESLWNTSRAVLNTGANTLCSGTAS